MIMMNVEKWIMNDGKGMLMYDELEDEEENDECWKINYEWWKIYADVWWTGRGRRKW